MGETSKERVAHAAEVGLQRLIDGNARFVRGQARFPTVCKETLAALARAQNPYATILGCSDSRVPPELIFDAEFGELFIIRVAGNVITPGVKGSLQYAAHHLHTPLIVVLGHEGCGAVKAALEYKHAGVRQKHHIQVLVDHITPGLEGVPQQLDESERLSLGVEANVRWAMQQLRATAEAKTLAREGARLVGGVYEIATGRVRFLDDARAAAAKPEPLAASSA